MITETYTVRGMTCAACSSSVERVTKKLDGVSESSVNLTTAKLTITYNEKIISPEMIMERVRRAGFEIEPVSSPVPDDAEEEKELLSRKHDIIGAAILTVILLYVSMGQMMFHSLPVPAIVSMTANPVGFALCQLALTVPVLFFGRRFFTKGLKALVHRNPNMDSLVAIGSGSSFLYSTVMTAAAFSSPQHVHDLYFESAAVVITLVMLGKYFEARSRKKTRSAITKLMQLTPDTALLVENDTVREVPSSSLQPGNVVLVKPGAGFPADGEILSGHCTVNESMLTGESLPIEKTVGDTVLGGSITYNGSVYVRVTKTGAETTISKIIRLVEEAQGKKAPAARLADKIAGVFVPVVMGIAVLAAICWMIAGKGIAFSLQIFTSVLVIACPCALGLATPTAIMAGTGLGAQHGILIRSGQALENTGRVTDVVLDKTGTITTGKPSVCGVYPFGDFTEADLRMTAASAESMSDHPVASAITESAGDLQPVTNFENMPGLGICADLADGRTVLAGNLNLLQQHHIDTHPADSLCHQLSTEGKTPVAVAVSGCLAGVIAVSDTIRESSTEAVKELHKLHIRVHILSGDRQEAAEYVGRRIGADSVSASILPDGKAAMIQKLREEGRTVMMIGDGINDAPALTQADIGVAIGGGSDIAVESGDIVLMRSDLRDAVKAIRLSRYTLANIKENLFWAFCYNVVGLPVAAGVLYPFTQTLLNPMLAGLAMSLSSVCVVTNALRLGRKKL